MDPTRNLLGLDLVSDDFRLFLTPQTISQMTFEERQQVALSLVLKGREYFASRNWDLAAQYLAKAIDVVPQPLPMLYEHLSTCYKEMRRWDLVILSTTVAMQLLSDNQNVISLRAEAHTMLNEWEDAYFDYALLNSLQGGQVPATAMSIRRAEREMTAPKANAIVAARPKYWLPCHEDITEYLDMLRPRLLLGPTATDASHPSWLKLSEAWRALDLRDYGRAYVLLDDALAIDIPWEQLKAEALNYRAAFRYLASRNGEALQDLQEALKLDANSAKTWVQLGIVYGDDGDVPMSMSCFGNAERIDAKDAKVYFHRGEVMNGVGDCSRASAYYLKASTMDPFFTKAHLRYAFTVSQTGPRGVAQAIESFEFAMKLFPERSEVCSAYGELLTHHGNMQYGLELLEKAITLAETTTHRPPPTPDIIRPSYAKGNALWRLDSANFALWEQLCRKCLRLFPDSCVALHGLGDALSTQPGREAETRECFERLARRAAPGKRAMRSFIAFPKIFETERAVKRYVDQVNVSRAQGPALVPHSTL